MLTPDMESQAGLNLLKGYLRITGSTGAFAKNAPVLNGRRKPPFVVVPSVEHKKQIKTAISNDTDNAKIPSEKDGAKKLT